MVGGAIGMGYVDKMSMLMGGDIWVNIRFERSIRVYLERESGK
jgi:hypothetical protein